MECNKDDDFGLSHSESSPLHCKAKNSANVDTLHRIIDLQEFSGAWSWGTEILDLINVEENSVSTTQFGPDDDVTATVFVVAYLEDRMQSQKDVWEMVVAMARFWL